MTVSRETFTWKYVDSVDPIAIKELQDTVRNSLPSNTHFFQGLEFLNVKTFMGLPVQRLVLIQIEPYRNGVIHVDERFNNNVLALNLPLDNCENSYTEIWESSAPLEIRYTINKVPYNYIDKTKCKMIDRFTLDKPVMFRTDHPHSANNIKNSKLRRALSIRFEIDPWDMVGL